MVGSKIIKNWYGERIGELVTDSMGNVKAFDRYGALLGTFNPKLNITTEFPSGRIISTGDTTNALIWAKEGERQAKFGLNKK